MKTFRWDIALLAFLETLIFLFLIQFISGLPGVFDSASLNIGKGPSDSSQIFACRDYNWRGGSVDSFCDFPTYIGHTFSLMWLSFALYFLILLDSLWLPWSSFVSPLQRVWIIFIPWIALIFFYWLNKKVIEYIKKKMI
jgi:hypothetical protein